MSGRTERMKLVRDLRKAGFDVERTGGGHWKVSHPEDPSKVVIMAFSPNSPAEHKTRKRLAGIGFKR